MEQFETDGAGRWVCTSQKFCKATAYAVPLVFEKQLVKFVLLCAIPGDLSDHGVAVNFKATRAGNLWQSKTQQQLGAYASIPKHILTEEAAKECPVNRGRS